MIVTRLSSVFWIGLLFLLGFGFRGRSYNASAHPSEDAPAGASVEITTRLPEGGNQTQAVRTCTVQDLLPLPGHTKSQEWSDEYVIGLPYDCTCAALKARYFCPTQDSPQYPIWEPLAVTEGLCRSTSRTDMAGGPFPPNFKVLIFGNSHLRQVVEGMVCMFADGIDSKRVRLGSPGAKKVVPVDTQCRACSAGNDKEWLKALQSSLLDHQCMAAGSACRCDDDTSQYFFKNGAILHYTYSSTYQEKTLLNARSKHEMDALSSYDAVIMNAGNGNPNATHTALKAAGEVQTAGKPFFWLSTYDGIGRISDWDTYQTTSLLASGATYVDIESMARGMDAWTKCEVEGVADDEHFCLPGPPNEIALLLLKLLWAVYEESKEL